MEFDRDIATEWAKKKREITTLDEKIAKAKKKHKNDVKDIDDDIEDELDDNSDSDIEKQKPGFFFYLKLLFVL